MYTLYATLGAIVFSGYIVYSVQVRFNSQPAPLVCVSPSRTRARGCCLQLIIGRGQHDISPDEYVFAALCLYLDIINLFL